MCKEKSYLTEQRDQREEGKHQDVAENFNEVSGGEENFLGQVEDVGAGSGAIRIGR